MAREREREREKDRESGTLFIRNWDLECELGDGAGVHLRRVVEELFEEAWGGVLMHFGRTAIPL